MSQISDHYSYIIRHVKECFLTPIYAFDNCSSLLCPVSEEEYQNLSFYKRLNELLQDDTKTLPINSPLILVPEDNIYIIIFPCPEHHHLILGPMGSKELTLRQKDAFYQKYHLAPAKSLFPKMKISQLMSMCSVIWFMLTGEPVETHQINIKKGVSLTLTEADSVEYRLHAHKEDKNKNSFQGEQIWCNYIETGDIEKMNEMIANTQNIFSSFESVGILAQNNDYKQTEYTLVTAVSLATHAAIRGGVSPFNCYEASDLLLQKAAVCNDILKLYDLFIETFQTFTMMVYLHNQRPRYGILIEQCKDYIARNLYQPFKITDMSANLHINNNYLSQLFSKETGMTIQQYIRSERLNAAANLLKYSEESVGQISDYMQFSSPSRFSSYFKEKYDMTPLEYRNKYKIAEFME